MRRAIVIIGATLIIPTAFGQQLGLHGFRIQLPLSRPTTPASSDVATLQWTAETQAATDQLRAQTCPVTIDQVPPANHYGEIPIGIPEQAQAILSRVWGSSSYKQGLSVSQVTNEVCAPDMIAKDLADWHYAFQFSTGVKPQQSNFLQRMPPGLMCYVDNKGIGDFLHNFPLQFASGSGMYQRYDLPGGWEQTQMAPIIAQAAQSFSGSCHTWYVQHFFQPLLARAEGRNNDVASIQRIYATTGLAPGDWIVWEAANNPVQQPKQFSDVEQFFNELNIAVQQSTDKERGALEFVPPAKGEFEKTVDYDARVEQLRSEHEKDHAKLLAAATQNLIRARQETFLAFIGSPEVSESIYDADKEQLHITITSKSSPLRVVGTIPLPLSQAQSVKSQVSSSTVHVLMGLKDGKFTVNTIVLWPARGKIYGGSVIEYTKSPITFGSTAAEQWPRTLSARADDQRRRDILRRQAEADRIQEEARSNPRLAFTLQKAQSGDARCSAIWSNAVAMAREPGISDSAFNQVVSKLEATADRIGCP